jgi:hypothetical protein
MLPADFRDVCAGVNKRIERETMIHNSFRKLAFFSLIPHAKEGFSFSQIMQMWPLPGDDKIESDRFSPDIDKDLYEKMVKAHGLRTQKRIRRKQHE